MSTSRPILLVVSTTLAAFVLVGGLAARVGAGEGTSKQAILFSEILGLVEENYVDPVDEGNLIEGAFEGMLGGLDPNGAYLTPAEVVRWKAGLGPTAGVGIAVLKSARSFQVVAVEEGSAAEAAGIRVGDHLRSVDEQLVRDLSLTQVRRLLAGEKGSAVRIEILHPDEAYERESIDLVRGEPAGKAYRLEEREGIALLRINRLEGLDLDAMRRDLDHLRSRGGIDRLLLDLRNLADAGPREVVRLAGLIGGGPILRLRDRSGRLLESVESDETRPLWDGPVAVLVNGATAGAGEALAGLVRERLGAKIYGQSTYGLGSEARLYELDNGAGLLVSAALWETVGGESWNVDGLAPDVEIAGQGDDYAAASADQLERVIERVRDNREPERSGA